MSVFKRTRSPSNLRSLIIGSKLFLFGDNTHYHGEDGWFIYLLHMDLWEAVVSTIRISLSLFLG